MNPNDLIQVNFTTTIYVRVQEYSSNWSPVVHSNEHTNGFLKLMAGMC
jgi:hypothetical protein